MTYNNLTWPNNMWWSMKPKKTSFNNDQMTFDDQWNQIKTSFNKNYIKFTLLIVRFYNCTVVQKKLAWVDGWVDGWMDGWIKNSFIDCCKQSLTRLSPPSYLPSIHPSSKVFCTKYEQLDIYCINLLQFCANCHRSNYL